MLTVGDSIADADVLQTEATTEMFDQIRTPSTIQSWLRGLTWAAVRMLDLVSRRVPVRTWQARLGPDVDDDLAVNLDSTVWKASGTAKECAKFSYTVHVATTRCSPPSPARDEVPYTQVGVARTA